MNGRSAMALPMPALMRLLRLASPSLPIGAFAYSQGLEGAIDAGWVRDEASATDWILGLAEHSLAAWDVPVLARLDRSWKQDDARAVRAWNDLLFASRAGAELQAEDRNMGAALARVLLGSGLAEAEPWVTDATVTHAAMFGLASARWGIPVDAAAYAFVFSWCENQVAAALRLVPLGQSAGQRVLEGAIAQLPLAITRGLTLEDADIGASAPGHALAAVLHETQYSRIFRS